jgi:hypothetical protein
LPGLVRTKPTVGSKRIKKRKIQAILVAIIPEISTQKKNNFRSICRRQNAAAGI